MCLAAHSAPIFPQHVASLSSPPSCGSCWSIGTSLVAQEILQGTFTCPPNIDEDN